MFEHDNFPRLAADRFRVTSPATFEYNCIAWSVGDTKHWWQPGVYWPIPAERDDFGIEVLVQAFRCLGFEECADATLEADFEKVAIYGETVYYTHAARQLPSGKWTSKLGRAEDIEHESPDDVAGGLYGQVARYMKRAISKLIESE